NRRQLVYALAPCLAVLMLGAFAGPAQAQRATDYPNRPVRIVVPYAAGGPTDFIARGTAEKLSQQMGQQFFIENRGGAAGALGAEAVVKSTPDGYTLLLTPQAPIQLLPHLRKLNYDPIKDLIPVGRMSEQIAGFAVHPSLGVKNMTEFVALAKKNPGKFTFGTAGVGSVNHLRVETLQLMVDSIVLQPSKSGHLTLLSVLTPERYSEFPDVATMREQGFPDYDVPVWFGTYAPAGVPEPILEKLHREIAKIHSDAEFQAKQFAGGHFVYREALSLPQLR